MTQGGKALRIMGVGSGESLRPARKDKRVVENVGQRHLGEGHFAAIRSSAEVAIIPARASPERAGDAFAISVFRLSKRHTGPIVWFIHAASSGDRAQLRSTGARSRAAAVAEHR